MLVEQMKQKPFWAVFLVWRQIMKAWTNGQANKLSYKNVSILFSCWLDISALRIMSWKEQKFASLGCYINLWNRTLSSWLLWLWLWLWLLVLHDAETSCWVKPFQFPGLFDTVISVILIEISIRVGSKRTNSVAPVEENWETDIRVLEFSRLAVAKSFSNSDANDILGDRPLTFLACDSTKRDWKTELYYHALDVTSFIWQTIRRRKDLRKELSTTHITMEGNREASRNFNLWKLGNAYLKHERVRIFKLNN